MIFQHRTLMEDMAGYNCLAFINPVGNDKDFSIKRIQVDVSFMSDVCLFVLPVREDIKGVDVTDKVSSKRIGEIEQTTARFVHNPYTETMSSPVRFACLQTGMPFDLLSITDGAVLSPGYMIIVRAKPWEVNKWINIFINYKENTVENIEE